MARAGTAAASARAEAWHDIAYRAFASFRRAHSEPVVRWALPASIAAFFALLMGVSCAFLLSEEDRIVSTAMTDVELVASLIADNIDIRIQGGVDKSPMEALAHAIPSRTLLRGQRVFLSDRTGRIVAGYPQPDIAGKMTDRIDASLSAFAEKAGVIRVNLADGSEALATVRTLRSPLGQIAVVYPMREVMADWRAALSRIVAILVCVGGVFSMLAVAYLWQATRARRADFSCKTMRDRVDMVLSRGRCGLWDWDLTTGRIDWSHSMYELIGLAPRGNGLSAAEIKKLVHPDDKSLDAILRETTVEAKRTGEHAFRLRHANGGWVWLRIKTELADGDGTTPHLVGIAIDVTETMALEERTAQADMRLRDAIETISEAFVVWDAANRLVMCNSKFQRFHNLPDDAVAIGTPYATVMAHGTPPVVQAQVAVANPQPLGARTFEVQLGDGRWLQVDERRTKDGGYVSVGTDITALKRHEEQLLESERRLMHSVVELRTSRQELETQAQVLAELAEKYLEQKAEAEKANRAKSDFLANMGHELRTPLNAILGFSEIMMMESYGGLGSPLYQEYCKDIHASGQYLLTVIADVLEMSRLEAGRVRLETCEFVLREAIEGAITTVAPAAQANGVSIEADVDGSLRLLADKSALQKVLKILLNNAVKYTPADGKVSIRSRAAQGAINLYVEDNGVGITPEAIERLGRPFEQSAEVLKDGMRGSGLGLAIARSLVELHGGSLRIKSKPGVGTLVQVHIPNRVPAHPHLLVTNSAVRATTRPPRFSLQPGDRTARKISRTA